MTEVCLPRGELPDAANHDASRQPSREALLQQIAALELKLQQRDEELAEERERSSRARKKARQLLAKLAERDEALAELRAALDTVRTAASAAVPALTSGGRTESKQHSRQISPMAANEGRSNGSFGSGDMAVRKRTEIVAQLEDHLVQMRANLEESEREIRELEDRKLAKEAEWNRTPECARSRENAQTHRTALQMIRHQVHEKKRFAKELTHKTRELEAQVAKQRKFIQEHRRPCNSDSVSEAEVSQGEAAAVQRVVAPDLQEQSVPASPSAVKSNPAATTSCADEAPELQEQAALARPSARRTTFAATCCIDEALSAFLDAAGAAAEVITRRLPLRAAFEARPPQLSASAIDGCSPEERAQALSLFAAWVAVAGSPPRAMRLCDVGLKTADATELRSTLEACGAQLEEWEMTRCPANDSTMKVLFQSLATQPLVHLNLSYNALGPAGATGLVGAMPAWTDRMQSLILEMNGLGDKGCKEVATALAAGRLPCLRVLELGWNELTAASAPVLSALLAQRDEQGGRSGGGSSRASSGLPRIQKLGLGGNGLGSEGAQVIVRAALAVSNRALDLDLSMNHVGAQPLCAFAEWAEGQPNGFDLRVSISLEWNIIDDAKAVCRLARALAGSAARSASSLAQRPLVRLANNELTDMEPAAVLTESGGLISC